MSFKQIVRVAKTDLDGNYSIEYGLTKIKGVSYAIARLVSSKLGINPEKRLGELGEKEIRKIEELLLSLDVSKAPAWLLNRRKDLETGRDIHLIGPALTFKQRTDINRERKMKSWRGVRHSLGLKVRGQRTRTTGRKGIAVGVRKKGR